MGSEVKVTDMRFSNGGIPINGSPTKTVQFSWESGGNGNVYVVVREQDW